MATAVTFTKIHIRNKAGFVRETISLENFTKNIFPIFIVAIRPIAKLKTLNNHLSEDVRISIEDPGLQ